MPDVGCGYPVSATVACYRPGYAVCSSALISGTVFVPLEYILALTENQWKAEKYFDVGTYSEKDHARRVTRNPTSHRYRVARVRRAVHSKPSTPPWLGDPGRGGRRIGDSVEPEQFMPILPSEHSRPE